ncbi:MAG: alpha-2-macroglobulin family protein [Sediminibacterium sp.]|nr:alpha-2-macroglobulin family protein [Sediminibacterium sp.]MDP3126880.1 alpha-2-macroglobulin family protein [Sediminibacterium sp.]
MALRNLYISILLLVSLGSQAGTNDTLFKKEWIGINTILIKQDLTRTALDKVNTLYQKAKQKKLPDQVIKCLIYQYSLQGRITSVDPNPIIQKIQSEITLSTDETQKAILHSLLAKLYLQYFSHNRWRIYGRKKTADISKEDITTWGIDDFHLTISKHFILSLKNTDLLKQQGTATYHSVIIQGNMPDANPTLFNLLAYEALKYFKSGENYLNKPAYAFTINDEKALAPLDEFIQARFITADSTEQQWISLQLFQQLLSFHRNDKDKNTLLQINLDRIEWVYINAAFLSKETAYINALEEITTKYKETATASQAWYNLAKIEADKAAGYKPFEDTANRYSYIKVKKIAEKALLLYKDTTRGAVQLQNLLSEIAHKELRTQTEKVSIPGKPIRALVTYRNVNTLYGRILRIKSKEELSGNQWATDYWEKALRLKVYQAFTQALPQTSDYQQHSVEIKLESLPVGEYALLSASSSKFNTTSDKMSLQIFHVSNISYVKNNHDFFILNRNDGQAIENAKTVIYQKIYSQIKQNYVLEKIAEKTTNSNGYFRFVEKANAYNISYRISKGDDVLDINENDFFSDEPIEPTTKDDGLIEKYERTNQRVFFFTDRGIYRPGQPVFFKGIAITKDYRTKLSKLFTSKDSGLLYLKDANRKKIDSARFALNEYGSFHGKFLLPVNGLTGQFSIEVAGKNMAGTYFSVEEYKRPGFHIVFEKISGAYRLNDSVTIAGNVKAFAGNSIDGATVVYSVKRNIRFNDPWLWRRPYPFNNGRETSHGVIKTNTEGKFTITFKAGAEDITDRTGNPLFDFSISADVTDINGETHSNQTIITTGFSSLLLNISAPSLTEIDSFKNIAVSSTNLSYEKEPAQVHLKIYALQAPERIVRKRYWTRPDQFVISRDAFIHDFPTDEYEEESNYQTWLTGDLVNEGTVNTKDANVFPVKPGTMQAGYYRIEATAKDKDGGEIKNIRYIQLFNFAHQQLAAPTYQFNHTISGSAVPGQTASFISGSMADQVYLVRNTGKLLNKTSDYQYIQRKKGLETIQYTPDENDRGGVTIDEVFVYDNRVYSYQYYLEVPWNNKRLQVQYATYRNKTEPGSKENWTVTVQNNQHENAAAELLTGMYDASLDQFKSNNWAIPYIWETNNQQNIFSAGSNFSVGIASENTVPEKYLEEIANEHDHLAIDIFEFLDSALTSLYEGGFTGYGPKRYKAGMIEAGSMANLKGTGMPDQNKSVAAKNISNAGIRTRNSAPVVEEDYDKVYTNVNLIDSATGDHIINGKTVGNTKLTEMTQVQTRKKFNETAFFFPQLYADSTGKYSFSFTMPEAMTQWKWMSLAHTKDLAFGSNQTHILTQKKLMIQPNAPRFMREGDNIEFSAKIVNLGDTEITGQVSFELIDATSNTSVDGWFQNIFPSQYFTVEAGQSFPVQFPMQVPYSFNRPLTWRIIAKAGEFSDGEENTLPVLSNRMLVTESLPLLLQTDTTQVFKFEKLLHNNSETLSHESFTIEYTSNPVWYAIQALPYLIEYPYECSEQSFNRLYANTLASFIVNKYPAIKEVFEKWKSDSSSLKSKLQTNEALKQILLQETPWVLQAESEEQQQKNISLLFDLVKLSNQTESLIEKLAQLQLPDGSFSWFKGGYSDRYITNYILTGIGKLKRLGALSPGIALRIRPMLVNALKYADSKLSADHQRLVQNKTYLAKQQISSVQIEYLYMRSFFRDIAQQSTGAYQYFYQQGKQFWIKQNSYYRAQLGLVYYRNGDEKFAKLTILPALLENAIQDTKQGMYWKTTYTGSWYQSPIEHQTMLVAFMSELNQEKSGKTLTGHINAMKTWLLLNKQTNNWKTTIATADACYALLLNGTDWLSSNRKTTIQAGNYRFNNSNEKAAVGTGYFKKRIEGKMVVPEMGNITVSSHSTINQSPSWGTAYWQYFEELDKITTALSPLTLRKQLFIERNTDKGKVLFPVQEGDELKKGDKIIIRIALKSDRDMDYLHLKDMRAASMEPVNVLSSYKWQDGLGYYESTKEASTNFFIGHLPKGNYIFDYPVFITHTGVFSVGIASIQCMYAPVFTSHSEGIKIRVSN